MGSTQVFTVGNAAFFPGVVALVNSLRITGTSLPVVVLDTGFTPEQRRLLESHCELRAARPGVEPVLSKLDAPLQSDAETVLLIDSDIVVTGSLDPCVAAAGAGDVYVFVDRPAPDRWFAEWEELFALDAPPRHQPAANAGFLAVSKRHFPTLLSRWFDLNDRLARPMKDARGAGYANPLWLWDQDALNALLMSLVPADRITMGPPSGMAIGNTFAEVRVVDTRALQCTLRGDPVTMLHAIGHPKPWQPSIRWRYWKSAYARCLRRVLTGPDVEIRIPDAELVPWMRSGVAGAATGTALNLLYAPARRTRPFRVRVGLSPLRPSARRYQRRMASSTRA